MDTDKEQSTKVKELKQKLSEEQNKNSITTAILEGGTIIMWAVDTNRKLTSFNQNYFSSFMNNSANGVISILRDENLIESPENEFWKDKYQEPLKGQSINFEVMVTVKNKDLWKEVFLNPIYESSGEISGVSGLAYDITEKMNSKLALVKSEQMFRNIFQSFQDLYFRCNFSGEVIMLSPSVVDITGYRENELIGKNITNYYLYKAQTKSLLKKLIAETRIRNFDVDIVHKNGQIIPCICNVRLIFDDQNKPIYVEGVARDIKELNETNKQLLEAKELAEESLKVKERFLANMSHEIRTPLNGIIGMIHLLEEPNLSKEQKKHLKSLKNSSDILLNILNDLLDLSKIEAGKMVLKNQPVNTNHLIKKLQSLYGEQAKQNNITLACTKDRKVPAFIFTDETKLLQIFSNLISNAIKFTPEGGTIDVTLVLAAHENTGRITLEGKVTDSGIGIQEENKKKLFKSFTQLDSSSKKAYKGTGLGLYITRQLVELFGGEIGVDSTPENGSTFTFTIQSSTTRIRPEEKDTQLKQLEGQPQVLVVDDNEINLELASAILQTAGCELTLSKSGADSLIQVQSKKFDVILMDIQMPDIDGVMAARNIRSQLMNGTPPIIAMTAYSMSGDENRFLNMGFDDYIAKPVKPDMLISKIESCLNSKLSYNNKTDHTENNKTFDHINLNVIKKLEEFGGIETVKTALNEFDHECTEQISRSKEAFDQKNIEEVLNNLHTLKGNAGTLGVEKMASQAEKLETHLKIKKYSIFESELSILKQLHISFRADLEALFNQKD